MNVPGVFVNTPGTFYLWPGRSLDFLGAGSAAKAGRRFAVLLAQHPAELSLQPAGSEFLCGRSGASGRSGGTGRLRHAIRALKLSM